MLIMLTAFLMDCTSRKSKDIPTEKREVEDIVKVEKKEKEPGKNVYQKYCMTCHLADGKGIAGLYPPLNATGWVNGDKERLIRMMLQGIDGEIKVKGLIYNQAMASYSYLSDKEVSDVLTYIRTNFGNDSGKITVEEVSMVRDSLENI